MITNTDAVPLPCPFCGCEQTIEEHEPHEHSTALVMLGMPPFSPGSFTIACPQCECGMIHETREGLIAAWNRRVPSPEVQAESAFDMLATLLDVWDDSTRAPEHRHYVDGAWRDVLAEAQKLVNNRPAAHSGEPFQVRVQPWMLECFGAEIAADTVERNHRFFEESAELVQACGMTASEAHQLVDYTWSRPIGEKAQEVGGVMVTLAALCLANKLDMHADGETELARINQPDMIVRIRAKQASKPKHSPLPEVPPAAAAQYQWRDTGPLETGDTSEP